MKIKQTILIASALSCAAVAAIGYLAGSKKKEQEETKLLTESEAKE